MKAVYINKAALTWDSLKNLKMGRDRAGRWDVTAETPEWVKEYLNLVRTPSRSWPNSYAKALQTQKFAKLLTERDPSLAVKLGIATTKDKTETEGAQCLK